MEILKAENLIAVSPALIGLIPVAFAVYDLYFKRKK